MDLKDLCNRWQRARLSSLKNAASGDTDLFGEERLLERISSEQQEAVLSSVFLNSRNLAQSFTRYHGLSFELQDFQDALKESEIACFKGTWERRNGAMVLTRGACSYASGAKEFTCAYWREALDGLVMGLGEEERSARHGCARVDGGSCVDVLFTETSSVPDRSKHFGVIPPLLAEELDELKKNFLITMKTEIEFVGYSAGTLYFHFPKGTSCGSGSIFKSALLSKVKTRHPYIKLQDISPRAVLGVES